MTQLAGNRSRDLIQDLLDAVGRKRRLLRVARGGLIWIAWSLPATTAAALAAGLPGEGRWTACLRTALLAGLFLSAIYSVLMPLLTRPAPLAVARLIEQRMEGLHDGLTNTLLLARSKDLADNPWLPEIYDEVLAACQKQPMDSAVRFSELAPLGLRLSIPVAAAIILAALFPGTIARGWRRMLSPGGISPAAGAVRILEAPPGDGTQIVPRITLTSLDVTVSPPPYTRRSPQTLTRLPPGGRISVPLGSRVRISTGIDAAAQGAVLLVDWRAPAAMNSAEANHRFAGELTVTGDCTVFAAILGGGRIVAKLPDNGLLIHAINDAPPTVTMLSPAQNQTLPPTTDLTISAQLADDYGVASARLRVGFAEDDPAVRPGSEQRFSSFPSARLVRFPLKLTAEQSRPGDSITVQVEATDNRDLTYLAKDLGPQSSRGPKIVIQFQDPPTIAREESEQVDRLSARLQQMLRLQQGLHDRTLPIFSRPISRDAVAQISSGQSGLRQLMLQTVQTFDFTDRTRVVQKTLVVMAAGVAAAAVELADQIVAEPLAAEQIREARSLKTAQESIIQTLQVLLADLNSANSPSTQPASPTGLILGVPPDAFKKLAEALRAFAGRQRRILNQTAPLAKKPVDDYDAQDKKNLDNLAIAEDKLDAFMQESLADFSKNAEQDMSDPSLVNDLMQIYTQAAMAKDALDKKLAPVAAPLEEMSLELAGKIATNLDKFLYGQPHRSSISEEDPLSPADLPMAELPSQMQDVIGDLLERQEDLDQKLDDANANWHDSLDAAVAGKAMEGPLSDTSAKGISADVLPSNNEMQGRSGEGRNARSSGEFVGDVATGKGGRNTPTRLDPSPFQAGQIKDTSTDPTGGATGGGKFSGEGASGLQGPAPPKLRQEMQRLTKMQAQIRNAAERLNLQYKLGRYDNFKLLRSIVNMRQVESDLAANRYDNALRRTDDVVDDLESSGILLGGRMAVEHDTTPTAQRKTRKEIQDAEQGDLPPVWSEALREYYRKLAEQ